ARLRPAAGEIGEALEALATLRQRPIGHLRLSVPRIALDLVIVPVLPEFRPAYPDVRVEVEVDDTSVGLTAARLAARNRTGGCVGVRRGRRGGGAAAAGLRRAGAGAPRLFRRARAPALAAAADGARVHPLSLPHRARGLPLGVPAQGKGVLPRSARQRRRQRP